MQHYSLDKVAPLSEEMLAQAKQEPILLTEDTHPDYVLMSVQKYHELIQQLEALENLVWGELAEKSLQSSSMVGSERFLAELQKLAALEET